jgi:aspartate racemase
MAAEQEYLRRAGTFIQTKDLRVETSLSGQSPALGVLGGMGPLASSAFIRDIYEFNCTSREQQLPRIMLDSDPAFPDRTEAIRSGNTSTIISLLNRRLTGLADSGATRIVIACVTVHHFLDAVDPQLRSHVVSLPEVTVSALSQSSDDYLLLTTAGTRQARIFEREPGWPEVASRVRIPSLPDQEVIHDLVYRIKQLSASSSEVVRTVGMLLEKYSCDGVVAGCTELNIYAQSLVDRHGAKNVVSPLRIIAENLDTYMLPRPAATAERYWATDTGSPQ